MAGATVVARAVKLWLEQAVDAFGGDLPMRAPGELTVGAQAAGDAEEVRARDGHDATLATSDPSAVAADAGPGLAPAEPHETERMHAPPPAEDTGEAERRPRQEQHAPSPKVPSAAASDPAEALAALRARIGACTRCKLSQTRNQLVFGEGDPRARVMFIGEAPGFHEDQQGRPFVGAAGQLLDRIIENAMGMRRADAFIANVNKCRPPDNREPEPDEVAACLPFLREQVRIVRPAVIVCLGRVAASNLLGTTLPMRALRGRNLAYEGIPVVATWHPAYLLRTPAAKAETWEDIKRVNRLLGNPERPPAPPPA